MAQQEEITFSLIDDLDGSTATETVDFAIDGKRYEIDLNRSNAGALRKAIAPYVKAGRRKSGGRGRRPAARRRTTATAFSKLSENQKASVRQWAKRSRGRISDAQVAEWRATSSGSGRTAKKAAPAKRATKRSSSRRRASGKT